MVQTYSILCRTTNNSLWRCMNITLHKCPSETNYLKPNLPVNVLFLILFSYWWHTYNLRYHATITRVLQIVFGLSAETIFDKISKTTRYLHRQRLPPSKLERHSSSVSSIIMHPRPYGSQKPRRRSFTLPAAWLLLAPSQLAKTTWTLVEVPPRNRDGHWSRFCEYGSSREAAPATFRCNLYHRLGAWNH